MPEAMACAIRLVVGIVEEPSPGWGVLAFVTAGAGQDTRLTICERGEVCHPVFRVLARLFFATPRASSVDRAPWPASRERRAFASQCLSSADRSGANGKLYAGGNCRRNPGHRCAAHPRVASPRQAPANSWRAPPAGTGWCSSARPERSSCSLGKRSIDGDAAARDSRPVAHARLCERRCASSMRRRRTRAESVQRGRHKCHRRQDIGL